MAKPIQGSGGISWEQIKQKLATEGAQNVLYDSDLDNLIDQLASHTHDAADIVTGVLALARIPVLDWTKLQFFGIRQEILAKFTNPKLLIATSSMLALLNSAEKVEAAAGNISATSKELTIVGGTATAAGKSWIYLNLPEPATKVYVSIMAADDGNDYTTLICLMQSDGSLPFDDVNAYGYMTGFNLSQVANDFKLWKTVGGTATLLAAEAVDLTANQYYHIEFYTDINTVQVWRDGVLKFNVAGDTTNITQINSVQLMCNDGSTTAAKTSKFKGMVVIVYE